jgi:outer membrane protein assembly factor BamB
MRVMRSALDGSNMEILVQTGVGEDDMRDARNWCVGIAINDGMVYWTQKGPPAGGAGRILRAPLQQPSAALPKVLPAARTDIEVVFDNLPEPVDLEFGPEGALYWTDRAKTPDGGAVNRTSGRNVPGHHLLASDLGEAIGLAIDHRTGRIFVSTLQGDVYSLNLDGGDRREIVSGAGRLTGICYHRGHE